MHFLRKINKNALISFSIHYIQSPAKTMDAGSGQLSVDKVSHHSDSQTIVLRRLLSRSLT